MKRQQLRWMLLGWLGSLQDKLNHIYYLHDAKEFLTPEDLSKLMSAQLLIRDVNMKVWTASSKELGKKGSKDTK